MQKILVLSDLHLGSRFGPWATGDERARSKWKWLMGLSKDKPDALFLLGDIIDGGQSKAQGIGVYTADLGEQIEDGLDCLKDLCDIVDGKLWRVWGTPYHEGHGSETSRLMDQVLGIPKGQSGQVLSVKIDGVTYNLAHHPARKSCIYKGSACDAECIESRKAHVAADVLLRGHLHFFGRWETWQGPTVVFCPCLQGKTPYMIKNNALSEVDQGALFVRGGEILVKRF